MLPQQPALAHREVQRIHPLEQRAGGCGDALGGSAGAGGGQQPPDREHPTGHRQHRRHHGHDDEDDEDSTSERKRHIWGQFRDSVGL